MRIVLDVEADGLQPTQIWVIVCKDIDTGAYHIFRNLNEENKEAFLDFLRGCTKIIGHNLLGYDVPVVAKLLDFAISVDICLDTFIVSKLVDYPRDKHSIESYGEEFGIEKGKFYDWSKYSIAMEEYCIRDVDICHRIYSKYLSYISKPEHARSIRTEHDFAVVCSKLNTNGFALDVKKTTKLLNTVEGQLSLLDKDILEAFQPRLKLIREVTPKETKYGTISLTSIPKNLRDRTHELTVGGSFSHCEWVVFNPSSHKQIITVLNEAGWRPTAKTDTHKDTERELSKLKRSRNRPSSFDTDVKVCEDKLKILEVFGWKVNEENLDTLPASAPAPARLLAQRILYESRRRTLTEWNSLVHTKIEIEKTSFGTLGIDVNGTQTPRGQSDSALGEELGEQRISKSQEPVIEPRILNTPMDFRTKTLLEWLKSKKVDASFVKESVSSTWITVIGTGMLEACCVALATVPLDGLRNTPIKYKIISQRVHGTFQSLGAWTHRCSHQKPNMANVTNEFEMNGNVKLLGKELRQCWIAPKGRLLVGVDAESIQLRVFAHIINDRELINAIVNGKKSDKTDPHSYNKSVLGSACKSRQAAKRFLYALFLGAGMDKLSAILECTRHEGDQALQRLMDKYPGFAECKEYIIPSDAKRGWFVGLDGRRVRILGDDVGTRRHLAMSGYLQSGEKVIMAEATLRFEPELKDLDSFLVDLVHDEWQTECPNDFNICKQVAEMECQALIDTGISLKLNCPLAGSYYNDDHKDYTFGSNWYQTH